MRVSSRESGASGTIAASRSAEVDTVALLRYRLRPISGDDVCSGRRGGLLLNLLVLVLVLMLLLDDPPVEGGGAE